MMKTKHVYVERATQPVTETPQNGDETKQHVSMFKVYCYRRDFLLQLKYNYSVRRILTDKRSTV